MNKCTDNLNNIKREYKIQSYVGDSECNCNVYAALNKNVLRCRLNVKKVVMWWMSAGSSFQACAAVTENDLEPKAVREGGMSKWPHCADWGCALPGTFECGGNISIKYPGVCPYTTPCVRQHSLYVMRWQTGSQRSAISVAVMWSRSCRPPAKWAAAWRTCCNSSIADVSWREEKSCWATTTTTTCCNGARLKSVCAKVSLQVQGGTNNNNNNNNIIRYRLSAELTSQLQVIQ